MTTIEYTAVSNYEYGLNRNVKDTRLILTKEIENEFQESELGEGFIILSRWETEFYKMAKQAKKEEKERLILPMVQDALEREAKLKGYDSIISACTYATSKGTFGKEGQSFVDWRDAVWTYIYKLSSDIENLVISEPSYMEIIDGLPKRITE